MKLSIAALGALLFTWGTSSASAFVQDRRHHGSFVSHLSPRIDNQNSIREWRKASTALLHPTLVRQRRSLASIQTQGLFGLGGPEIAIILVAAAFLIGPQQLGNFAGKFKSELDNVPDELKKIPEEFQKGLEEGETNARARNAKPMEIPSKDKE